MTRLSRPRYIYVASHQRSTAALGENCSRILLQLAGCLGYCHQVRLSCCTSWGYNPEKGSLKLARRSCSWYVWDPWQVWGDDLLSSFPCLSWSISLSGGGHAPNSSEWSNMWVLQDFFSLPVSSSKPLKCSTSVSIAFRGHSPWTLQLQWKYWPTHLHQ